ncbi:MAG: DNA-directed RNA polymerase subunit alpha [Anaerolineaceae bacterium]|nr:DNA-directed RNA polymerase subunit alpha [Anaerolineaceae bacterium]
MTALSNMVMPKIEREAEARNYAKFIISPLEQGYGTTLGNALRRVILSSLDGVAVTAVRITDVLHEFSEVSGVREDVIQIILQIKKLRMILHDVDIAHMHLEIHGDGEVTAADIQLPPEIEIVNPDLYLFTVDQPTDFEIEFTVERGRGYSPSKERSGHLPIGELPVDAIFSPVKRVNWNVSSARVGQNTKYDRLTLEIWTDGTINPEESLSTASKIIVEHLRFISGISEESLAMPIEEEVDDMTTLSNEVVETPIENLDLSVRVFNSLKRTGIATVGDVIALLEKGDEAVMSIRNFGEKSLQELTQKMQDKGYLLTDEEQETE